MDLFSWSLPFLAEKVTSMLYGILKQCTPAELADKDDGKAAEMIEKQTGTAKDKLKRKLMLKNKIASVGRMNKLLTTLRENQEELLALK